MTFAIEWRLKSGAWSEWRAKLERDHAEHPDWGWASARSVGVRSLLEAGVQVRTDQGALFPPYVLWQEHEVTRRWQAEHGETVDPPLDDAERFGWTLPLVHLANGLAWRLIGEGFLKAPDGTETWYRAPEANFYLTFAKRGTTVAFTSSWAHSPVLRSGVAELGAGVRRFVARPLEDIDHHEPALLEWEAVQGLVQYAE